MATKKEQEIRQARLLAVASQGITALGGLFVGLWPGRTGGTGAGLALLFIGFFMAWDRKRPKPAPAAAAPKKPRKPRPGLPGKATPSEPSLPLVTIEGNPQG